MLHEYLARGKSLVLIDHPQVFFDPLRVQVLDRHRLHLKVIRLEVLEADTEKDFVCCFYLLNAVLSIEMISFKLISN